MAFKIIQITYYRTNNIFTRKSYTKYKLLSLQCYTLLHEFVIYKNSMHLSSYVYIFKLLLYHHLIKWYTHFEFWAFSGMFIKTA